jgi:hypothetical protein
MNECATRGKNLALNAADIILLQVLLLLPLLESTPGATSNVINQMLLRKKESSSIPMRIACDIRKGDCSNLIIISWLQNPLGSARCPIYGLDIRGTIYFLWGADS